MLRAVKDEEVDLNRVYKEIEVMFTNWSQVKKMQLKNSFMEYAANSQEENPEGLNESMFTAKADFSKCKYWSHVSYCRDALYSADEEDKNDK